MAENRFKGPQKTSRFKGRSEEVKAYPYWGSNDEALDTITMGGTTKANAAITALINATLDSFKGDGFDYLSNYDKSLSEFRAGQKRYQEENPVISTAAQGGGLALGVTSLPVAGRGILGALGTGSAYGAVGGSLEDANSIPERLVNTAKGAAGGALIGGGGYAGGRGVAWGLDKTGKALNALTRSPEIKAASEIADIADSRFGANSAHVMDQKIARLGPDAVRADVLGEPGYAVARKAANVSPAAREQIETFASGRKANQNVRLTGDVQKAGGVEQGLRKTVEELQQEAYGKVRPQINAAYDDARLAGADVPFEYFGDVLNTPVGKKAFEQAQENVATRIATRGEGGGNLAVLDETKRILDKMASMGYRAGDHLAEVSSDLSKHLRSQMDVMLDGDQYAVARKLRQDAYKAEEAFKLGEELGQRNVPLNASKLAGKVEPQNAPNMAAAYAQTKAQRLLNNANTEGAITEFVTPMGREAAQAALGGKVVKDGVEKGAQVLDSAVEREKLFNLLSKALGNSTTTRQLIETGTTGLAGAGIGGYLSDYAPASMTGTGILSAFARRTAPKIGNQISSRSQQRSAPELAKFLTSKGVLPENKVLPPNVLERLSKLDPVSLSKILLLELQNKSPQTKPAQ